MWNAYTSAFRWQLNVKQEKVVKPEVTSEPAGELKDDASVGAPSILP